MIDLLAALRPRLPAFLTSRPSWSAVERLATRFPPLSGAIIEWHLADRADKLDFSLRATAAEQEHLHAYLPTAWTTTENPLHRYVENTWLEFDLPGNSTPAFFFDLQPRGRKLSPTKAVSLATEAWQRLGHPATEAYRKALRHQVALLPTPARLRYLGHFPGRKGAGRRHCITGLAAAEILPILDRLAWTGPAGALGRALARFTPGADRLQLNLDHHPALAAPLSFEISVAENERWPPLVHRLPTAGLCSPAAAAALLAWPTYTRLPSGPVRRRISKVARRPPTWVFSRISHLKISVGRDGELAAKAYLFIGWA